LCSSSFGVRLCPADRGKIAAGDTGRQGVEVEVVAAAPILLPGGAVSWDRAVGAVPDWVNLQTQGNVCGLALGVGGDLLALCAIGLSVRQLNVLRSEGVVTVTVGVELTHVQLQLSGLAALMFRSRIVDPRSYVAEDAEADGDRGDRSAHLARRTRVAVRVLAVEFRLWWDPQVCVLLSDVLTRAWDMRRDRDAATRPWEDARDGLPWRGWARVRVLWDDVVVDPQVIDALIHLNPLASSHLSDNLVSGLIARTAVPLGGSVEQALNRGQSPPLLPPVDFQAVHFPNDAVVCVDSIGPRLGKHVPHFRHHIAMGAGGPLQLQLKGIAFCGLVIQHGEEILAVRHQLIVLELPVLHDGLLLKPWREQSDRVIAENPHGAVGIFGIWKLFAAFLPNVLTSLKMVPGADTVLNMWPLSVLCRIIQEQRRLPV